MSRAFVKEDDESAGVVPLPDRPISPHRILVTRRGLRLIEDNVARFEGELSRATAEGDREAIDRAARELRYWTARRGSAEVAVPAPGSDEVVFGAAVTLLRKDHSVVIFRIVGENEADPVAGRIAWTAPVARTLLGGGGDLITGDIDSVSVSSVTGANRVQMNTGVGNQAAPLAIAAKLSFD